MTVTQAYQLRFQLKDVCCVQSYPGLAQKLRMMRQNGVGPVSMRKKSNLGAGIMTSSDLGTCDLEQGRMWTGGYIPGIGMAPRRSGEGLCLVDIVRLWSIGNLCMYSTHTTTIQQ